MVQKRHVPLILAAVVLLVLLLSWIRIPEAFAAVQKSFVLNPDSASFSFEESSFNDSSVSKENNYLSPGNVTYWIRIPKNSTILNATMNLTGKIIYVYTRQITSSGLVGFSIGNATADLQNEISTGTYGSDGVVRLLHGIDGSYVWNSTVSANSQIFSTYIGNVTSDPGEEIAAGSQDEKIYLLYSNGTKIWEKGMGGYVRSVVMGDIYSSGINYVIVGASNNVSSLNSSGGENWSTNVGYTINSVALGNLTSNPGNEIAVGCDSGRIFVLNSSGSIVSSITIGSSAINSVDIGNITSDAGNEIAAGSGDYKVYIINSSGSVVWNYTTGLKVNSVKIGDVTTQYPGNEVVAGSNDKKVYTLDNTGSLIWSFEADNYINTIAIGNLTSDTGDEVAAGASDGYLYVFNFDYFPDNVSIDVNGSAYDWSYPDKLRTTVQAGGTAAFRNAIQDYLNSTCSTAMCTIPLLFHSDGPGKLNISSLNVTYSYNISNLVSALTVSAWSRTRNINVNESVGNQTRNLSFSNPSNDILVQYIRINQTATACDFNGSSYSVTTAEGQIVCDVPDFTIPSSGGLPGPFLLWDSNMTTGKPVLMSESAAYYTNTTNYFLWRKNLTIWNTSSTIIYNVTANVSLDDSAARGLEFLNVTWKGLICDITPAANVSNCNTANPTYTAKACSGDVFYSCKQDTNGNGVYDFFKWVQPYSNSSVSYATGGSTNLAANLSLQTVAPSQGIWGTTFNFSVYVNDSESDSVNVTLWIMRNLSGAWERNSTQPVSGSGQLSFNVSSNMSWVGIASYRFEYQDFNSSGYPMHSSQNTSIFTGPTASKHNTSVVLAEGNNSVVNRNSSVLLSARINDTETNSWTNESVSCVFWMTTNGANFDAGHYNTTNSSGYCNYLFTPDSGYSAGNQTWKAGVWNDTYYSGSNSTNFTLTVKGRINITLVSPSFNQSLFRNSTNTLTARMIDEYGSGPTANVSGYNCTFWFINGSANDLGNATTNSSGWCGIAWNPNCSVALGQFTVNVTLAGSSEFYTIQGSENDTQVLMKDVLLTAITSPIALSSFHKGDSLAMNSSANDSCLLCGSGDYQTIWSMKSKQYLQVSLNETRGFPRANETIIINGSELEGQGIDLSDWRINYTKVIYNGQEIPSEIKVWTDSSKSGINATQVFLNNYSELVFLANINALQAANYLVYYNESSPNDWNISYILNGGFESSALSPWSCINSSGCAFDLCDCRVSEGNNETAGNYSLRMLVIPSIDYTNMSVQQSMSTGINSSYIKIRYKPANMSSSSAQIRLTAGSGVCNLSAQPSSWMETLCYNTSFQNATLVAVEINSTTKDGTYRYLYIDYICIADSSGNCTSMDSGYAPRKTLSSQTVIGSGNTTWQVPNNETLGSRRILANSSGQNHAQNFSTVSVYLFGWSNISLINLSSGYCTYNQTFQCMSNATIDYYCIATDVNLSSGIHNYNVSFFMNGSYMGSNMTNASGYAVFRNSTGKGNYNISCNISNTIYEPNTYYNITSNNSASIIVDIISGNTTANVSLSPLTETASNITRESNYTFYLNVTVNNTGNGSMFNPLVNISAPAGIFVQPMSCPTLTEGSSCSSSLQANVSQLAAASSQIINITVSWSNADSTQGNATNQTSVTVENHTVLNITQGQINMSMARGNSGTGGNFTVEAYGNTPLSSVTFSLSGANSSEISGWISYNPSSISSIAKAGTNTTLINLTIPLNATEGIYTATLAANATGSSCSPENDCWDSLPLLINVTPPDWSLSPYNLSKTIGLSGQNGTIGTITILNSRDQNYSFSVAVAGNGSGYIKTDKSSFNVTALSSAYLYVYHNTTTAYNPGYWFANVTVINLNGAFPPSMNISVNLDVINLTISIISPNQTNPTLPVNASDRINLTVNATLSGANVTSNMVWTVLVGGQACGDVQSSYNSSAGFWEINCTAPNITGNVIYNTLTVTGNYTAQQGTIVSDQQADTVKYADITPPQPYSITVNPVNYYSSVPYILINATITDNTLVNSSWLVITQPNGTNVTVGNPSNLSSLYTFNFSNPNVVGDYDIYVFANDSYGYTNSTRGWFDVYRPFTMSGTLANPNSANQSINFTFYRNGISTVIHNFSTNSTQASYNWSVHDRVYDIRVSFFGHTAVLYGANTTASAISQHNSSATNVSGVFRLDNFPNRTSQDISNFDLPNTAQNIILGFVIETPNLSYSSSMITIDYTEALAAALGAITIQESNLRIFRCTNWNFQSRVCSSGEFSHFNESLTPNTTANTFTFTAAPSTAYAVAESCYPNICGQTPTPPPGGGTESPGGGTGPAQPVCGNGKCETGENSQNCPKDCPAELEFPLTIKTGITNIRLRPGDKATYPFYLTNNLNKTVTADISVAGLENYFRLEKTSVSIAPNKNESFNIYVTIPQTTEPGTYTGTITVSAEGKTKDIPVMMIISLEGRSQLTVIVKVLAKRVEPGNDLKYTVTLTNIGFGENLTVNMIYTVRNAQTEEIVKQENETLNLSLATGDSYIINRIMKIKEEDPPVGQYYLEVVAEFDHRSVSDTETFEVSQVFWASPVGQFLSWFIIIGAIVVMAFYERRRYNRWKMKKSRYLFPVNYNKIPQGNEDAFWIGKIAETEKKAWFNPNDLTTHVLIAGSTGAGKSVSASVFVEEALDKKIPVVVFDPTAQWTGFVKQCEDENLLKYYRQFGMDVRYTKPYKGMISEITDPHIIIDFKKYMNPGEITVFTMNKLGPGEYDVAVKNIINAIFKTGWEESTRLKMIMVFDEVHRLLEKYGGIGGYISLEQACREFRKWGIGIVMCSQVLADFKEAIAGNVLTDIQMNTKSLIDIRKVETKYGSEYATRISRQGVGVGMLQNPRYNEGKPYFIQFRPTWHNPHKITDEEMSFYKEFAQRLEVIERKIDEMRRMKKDVTDIEIELKLAKDKLKQGRFRMAKIYINSLEEHLNIKAE